MKFFIQLGLSAGSISDVYEKEKSKSASTPALIEREVVHVPEIVRTGCDPASLLPITKDFKDKLLKAPKVCKS